MYEMCFSDVNECDDNPCSENALCTDTVGSFFCTCKEGFTGDPFRGCVGELCFQKVFIIINFNSSHAQIRNYY
jgi:hypothetical protein